MASPSRFTSGISTDKSGPLRDYGLPDPASWHTWFNEFYSYTAADWVATVVEAGAGSASVKAEVAGDGGLLSITNDNANNDSAFLQWSDGGGNVLRAFRFAAGKKLVFKSRFKVNDANLCAFVMGLQINDTTPLTVSDGVFFSKDSASTALDFKVFKGSTGTTNSGVATLANDTYIEAGFAYDGKSSLAVFIDGAQNGGSVTTNLPDTEDLTVSFGIQNGEAAIKIMTIDYILAAKER